MELLAVSGWQLRGGEPVTSESQPTRELRGLREKKVFTLRELGLGLCTKQRRFHGLFYFILF